MVGMDDEKQAQTMLLPLKDKKTVSFVVVVVVVVVVARCPYTRPRTVVVVV